MNVMGITTSVLGLFVLGGLLLWQRENLSKVYLNVILMTGILFSGFATIVGLLLAVGAGEIILPLTSLVAIGLIGVAGVYSKRAASFSGIISPLNISALVVFFAGIGVIVLGTRLGLNPFLDAQENSVLAAAAGLAEGAKGAAVSTLMLLLTPLLTAAVTVITNFATRDADAD